MLRDSPLDEASAGVGGSGQIPIWFVQPPIADACRPSIALGILKSVLEGAGMAAHSYDANLDYLDLIGPELHGRLAAGSAAQALPDWLFRESAFGAQTPEEIEGYLNAWPKGRNTESDDEFKSQVRALRIQTPAFVDKIAAKIVAARPRVVGCTSTFTQHVPALALLRRIRELDPSIVTMLGGANCEAIMGRTTHEHFTWVDYVVSGEAEEIIAPLCRAILRDGEVAPKDAHPAVYTPGHRLQGYPQVKGPGGYPRASVKDMTLVPRPNYDDYFVRLNESPFKSWINVGLSMEASRGCWWGEVSHCTFCGLNGGAMYYRSKKPQSVIDEIDWLLDRHSEYNPRGIEFVDNIMDLEYLDTVLKPLSEREVKTPLFFEIKSNLKRWQVKLLSDAGVGFVQPGIESLDTEILKLMKKGVHAWQNILFLKWARQYGIHVVWNMIFLFPDEPDEAYQRMASIIPLITHLQSGSPVQLGYCRFSPYHTRAAELGIQLRPGGFYSHVYPLNTEQLNDLVYFFERTDIVEDAMSRPGLASCVKRLWGWRAQYRDGAGPQCVMSFADGVWSVTDTRRCAVEKVTPITDLGRAILEAGDESAIAARMAAEVSVKAGVTEEEAADEIGRLLERRFLLAIDDRIISLVLDAPITPKHGVYPGGWLAAPEDVSQQQETVA